MIHHERNGLSTPTLTRVMWSCVLLLGFGIFVLSITLTPEPIDRGARPALSILLSAFHRRGIPNWVDYATVEFAANVVLFVPLGILLVMLLPLRRWWFALLIGPALSIAIELTQLTAFADRFASVGDVFANSSGVFIGVGLSLALRVKQELRDFQRPLGQM